MKYLVITILAAMSFVACNSEGNNEEANADSSTATVETMAAPVAATPGAKLDPVCNMEKDSTWTDYTVTATADTVWFCSETCKTAFEANPAKYQPKG